jgi:hypothetical protein
MKIWILCQLNFPVDFLDFGGKFKIVKEKWNGLKWSCGVTRG